MPVRARKIEWCILVAVLAALWVSVGLAQDQANAAADDQLPADGTLKPAVEVAQQTPAQGTGQVSPQAPANGQAPTIPAGTAGTSLDYLYNKKPAEGSAAAQMADANAVVASRAQAADALNFGKLADPQARHPFDKYLSTSEVPVTTLTAYNAEMKQVSALLTADRTFAAWKELFTLAQYESIDAGVSRELANRIESIWNIGRASDDLGRSNEQLKEDINVSDRNADLMSENIREQDIILQRQANAGNRQGTATARATPAAGIPDTSPGATTAGGRPAAPTNVSVAGLEGRLQLTQEYLDSLEDRARIKLNDLKAEKLFEDAKRDFASYIQTLSSTGRYQQVVLAADFYRKIFNEDDYPVEIANQVNTSLETARNVRNAVDVFRYDVSRNQIADATTRLQEAFSASPLDPAVLGLERSLKGKSADFLARLDKMQNLIEARDFGPLESIIQDTEQTAVDFDGTKAFALMNAVKLESKLHLGKAKLAAQSGNLQMAMDEFESAAKAWPDNPALQDSSTAFFDTEDTRNQSVTEFDRLIGEKNYRAIFDRQLAFAPAIHGDSKREGQLADALEKIKNAEVATEKANVMRNAGDVCGAWETVEIAAKDLPDDNKLNDLRAELAGKAAQFVEAVNNARDAETRADFGFSLTWYAVAQHYYPASTIANDGITRLSRSILSATGG